MRGWRLRWGLKEFFSLDGLRKHKKILDNPFMFYGALLLKLVPNLYKPPVQLRLKQGGAFQVIEFMTLYIYKEIFVDRCYDINIKANSDLAILDVGANTGLFSIRMKQLFPESKIVCFEPYPPNYNQLTNNIKKSNFEDVKIVMKGVGGKKRKGKLFVHQRNIGGHSTYQSETGSDNSVDIEIVDVDFALSLLDGKDCDLLKLDCEGAEYEIVKSLNQSNAKRIKYILMEITPSLHSISDVEGHLEAIGYDLKKEQGLYIAALKTLNNGNMRCN